METQELLSDAISLKHACVMPGDAFKCYTLAQKY